jgi:hypothetical protein
MGVAPSTKYTLACVVGFARISGFLSGDSLAAGFTSFVGLLAEVSNRKVLQPATPVQGFLGFPVSKSECWDGFQDSKLQLHASYVALPT